MRKRKAKKVRVKSHTRKRTRRVKRSLLGHAAAKLKRLF